MKSVLINDTRIDHHHGCERVVSAIYFLAKKYGFPIGRSFPSHSSLVDSSDFTAALSESDVLVINGEGTLHHDRPAGLELLKAAHQARKAGKYVLLLNAGWEANTSEYGQYLKSFDKIVARDQASASEIRSFGVECFVTPDLSLYLPAPALVGTARNGRTAITDSVLQQDTLGLWTLARQSGFDLVSIQFPLEPTFFSRYKFVREYVGLRNLRNPVEFLRLVHSRLDFLKRSNPVTESWLHELSRYSLLLSGRFHACTLCILTGTPFLAIQSNTRKIRNLIHDSGLDPARMISIGEVTKVKSSDFAYSEIERTNLDRYIREGRHQIESVFHDVQQSLAS